MSKLNPYLVPEAIPPIKLSGFSITKPGKIKSLRSGYFKVIDKSVGGDAPKDFLRIYEYQKNESVRRKDVTTWDGHIAKVGKKYYPNESITEHLITRIGQGLEMNIAYSCLMRFGDQLRFLSRYFLKKNQELIHGADIMAAHLRSDRSFIDEIEADRESRQLLTFQTVSASIKDIYPDQYEEFLGDFIRLLAFDCIVGNNDRHSYNWGVIHDITGGHEPCFSPIYDTARGLFWNVTEESLSAKVKHANTRRQYLEKYVKNSCPKTGWDGLSKPNHFELLSEVLANFPLASKVLLNFNPCEIVSNTESLFRLEFKNLMSVQRQKLIIDCLDMRVDKYLETTHSYV